jgi:septum formation protein
MKIILASASLRRQNLLRQIGLDFDIIVPNIDEDNHGNLPPDEYVKEMSLMKCKTAALMKHTVDTDDIVISADTTVVLDGTIIGKPIDKADAIATLTALSGRKHTVYTGVTIRINSEYYSFIEASSVTFRKLSDSLIKAYANTDEPYDKAGSYGVQELGAVFIEKIEGDYTTVVGLPIGRVFEIITNYVDITQLWRNKCSRKI